MKTENNDLSDLRLRAQRIREFSRTVEAGVVVHLRHPTRFQAEQIVHAHRGDLPGMLRAVALASIIGWDGVRVRHALPEAKNPEDVLHFCAEAVELILDEQTRWLDVVATSVVEVMAGRQEMMEADRKNLRSGSDGSGPAQNNPNSMPPASGP